LLLSVTGPKQRCGYRSGGAGKVKDGVFGRSSIFIEVAVRAAASGGVGRIRCGGILGGFGR